MMKFFEENWLWRGTQSAIFYYVSCSPWIEWKHKRKRRNEANRAQKQREEVIATQPGQVQQPGAFQTNGDWVEEILMGPGPPKGWKRDPIVDKVVPGTDKSNNDNLPRSLDSTIDHCRHSCEQDVSVSEGLGSRCITKTQTVNASPLRLDHSIEERNTTLLTSPAVSAEGISTPSMISASSSTSDEPRHRPRPSLERRLSTAMDTFRDTLRSTMRPEKWNWIRYERDDEILSGFNQRVTEMWNRATNFGLADKNDSNDDIAEPEERKKQRKRAGTTESDGFDYERYTRNPEINELHPPVVSRLPTTRDEAAWMILPPPSAAIMEGKARPQDEPAMRWPLARIGRTPEDWKNVIKTQAIKRSRTESRGTESIPELSDSFTETSSSDEETWKKSSTRRHSTTAVEVGKSTELDLMYMSNGRLSQDRAGLAPTLTAGI